jgi:hypothetical protein
MKKTPASLRAEAVTLRRFASEAVVKAEQFELDAQRLEEEQEAREEANKMLVELFFAYRRQLRAAH